MKKSLRSTLVAFASLALLFASVPGAAAPPVKVDAATPSSGEQGTLDMDVVITGSSFEAGAVVDFLVTGSNTDKGNVVVKSVTYNSSTKLTAKVSLQNAKISDFDVKVTLMSGRNGKGISLFKVVTKQSGDTTPPGNISGLAALPATRAVTLKFVVPGDDGLSGRAAGYDVYYVEGTCAVSGTPLSGTPPGGTWVLAPRSVETTAYTSGSTDYFNVHSGEPADGEGLAAGVPHCVAIRARDEVPNAGPWSVVDVTTPATAGDWEISPRFRLMGGNRGISVNYGYPDPLGAPVLGWVVLDPSGTSARTSLQFESPAWPARYDVPAAPIARIDGFRMLAVPGPSDRVGAVFVGNDGAGTNYHKWVEVGPGGVVTTETAVSAPGEVIGGTRAPGAGLTYVQRDGAWNPVIAVERVIDRRSKAGQVTSTTRLEVIQRANNGVWTSENTGLTRTDSQAFLGKAELFTTPDGRLGFAVRHCNIVVYAERSVAGQWSFWDAGASSAEYWLDTINNRYIATAFDTTSGQPVLLRRSAYNGVFEITHPLADAKPLTSINPVCGTSPTLKPAAWQPIGSPEVDSPYTTVGALAQVDGAIFASVNIYHPHGKTAEQRLLYSCEGGASGTWQVASIDRTNGNVGTVGVGPVVVDGSIRQAYSWGRASHAGSGQGGTNEIAYSTLPDDFVVLASQPISLLCP